MNNKYFLHHELSLSHQSRAIGESFIASTNLGNARAEILGRFLEDHLPARISVRRGSVVDAYGTDTGELDLVAVDHDAGALRIGGESLAQAEAAVACVEVKSTLDKNALELACGKIIRVKKLNRTPPSGLHTDPESQPEGVRGPPTCPMGFVVAFGGLSWDAIVRHLQGNPEWYLDDFKKFGPDLIVIVGRGVMTKNDGRFLHYPTDEVLQLEADRSGIELLVGHVMLDRARYGSLSYEQAEYVNTGPVPQSEHPWHT